MAGCCRRPAQSYAYGFCWRHSRKHDLPPDLAWPTHRADQVGEPDGPHEQIYSGLLPGEHVLDVGVDGRRLRVGFGGACWHGPVRRLRCALRLEGDTCSSPAFAELAPPRSSLIGRLCPPIERSTHSIHACKDRGQAVTQVELTPFVARVCSGQQDQPSSKRRFHRQRRRRQETAHGACQRSDGHLNL